MRIARAIFLHSSRVTDLILTLKFDRYLDPLPENNFIFYGPRPLDFDLRTILEQYGIDTKNFLIMPDFEFWKDRQPEIDIYQFRGWISQQFIKLIVCDRLDYDYLLIQDCDTFNIKNYNWLTSDHNLCLYMLPNVSHSPDYYKYVEVFTNLPRVSNDCFVTEFMPVAKSHWIALKNNIETRYNQNWLKAMENIFKQDILQLQKEQIWFSEFELLGNWQISRDSKIKTKEQKRFVLIPPWGDRLKQVSRYNSVCNCGSVNFEDINAVADYIQKSVDQ